ncbi:MAG: hypothetical protein K2H13_09800 [Eubacterium sp.]|nr:hypothetical protein [Eubacterium sp.]
MKKIFCIFLSFAMLLVCISCSADSILEDKNAEIEPKTNDGYNIKNDFNAAMLNKIIEEHTDAVDKIIGVNGFCANINHNGQIEKINLDLWLYAGRQDYNYYFDQETLYLDFTTDNFLEDSIPMLSQYQDDSVRAKYEVFTGDPIKDWSKLSMHDALEMIDEILNCNIITETETNDVRYYELMYPRDNNILENCNESDIRYYIISDSEYREVSGLIEYEDWNSFLLISYYYKFDIEPEKRIDCESKFNDTMTVSNVKQIYFDREYN